MSKRFTDTKKWNDDWFISLDNDYRIIWQWLLDNCNHAGLCKRSIGLLNLMCRTNVAENDLISKMEGRVIVHDDYWFIPKFIKFQYSTLHSNKPAVLSVVKELFTHNCIKYIPKTFGNDYIIIAKSFDNYYRMIKDKDKDKDKDKENSFRVSNSNRFSAKRGGYGGNKFDTTNGQAPKAIKVDEKHAYFADGTKQILGKTQKANIKSGVFKANDIAQTIIF